MKPLPLIIYSLTLLLLGIWIGLMIKPEIMCTVGYKDMLILTKDGQLKIEN